MAAEMSDKSYIRITDPNLALNGKKMYLITGTGASNTDYFTMNRLTAVEGCVLTSTAGTAGTFTIATNVITMTNGDETFSGFAWGY